jgi:hypothetical protein
MRRRGRLRPRRKARSIYAAARPDQRVDSFITFDEVCEDRSAEARVFKPYAEVIAILPGFLPGGAEFDGANENSEIGTLVVVLLCRDEPYLDVQAEGLDSSGKAVFVLNEGADDCHVRSPFALELA